MPHITIEYSANVAEQSSCRTIENYRVANGSAGLAMIAIAVRIGPGRDDATKTLIIETLLNAAEAQLDGESGPLAIAWSIELNEINADFRINRNYARTRLEEAGT